MSLIKTLHYLCQLKGIDISLEALIANEVLHDDDILPNRIGTVLENCGLNSRNTVLSLDNVSFPCLLFLKNGTCCIVKEKENEYFILHLVEDDVIKETRIEENEFDNFHDKNVILVSRKNASRSSIKKSLESVDPKRWFTTIIKDNINIYFQAFIAAFFINIFVIISPLFVMNVYDRVIPNNAIDTLVVLAVGITVVYLFDFILKTIRSWLIGFAGKKADIKIGVIIFNKLLNLKLSAKPSYSGTFANNLSGFESLRVFFTSSTLALLIDLPFIFIFIFVIYLIGGWMCIVPIVTFIIGLIIAGLSQIPQRRYIEESFQQDQYKQGLLLETIMGLEIIKCTGLQSRMKKMWEESIEVLSEINEKSQHLNGTINYGLAFLNSVSTVAIISIGVFGVKNGEITMGAIIASSLLNGRVNAPISQIVSLAVRFERSMLSLSVLNKFMQMPVEREENKSYLSRPNLGGKVAFKNVEFKYSDESDKVINKLSLTIKEKEKVAIIGRIGSGKSTLAKITANLYDATDGSVLIDDTNISHIEPADLRKTIGYMPQDNFLFMGTVKDNIVSGTHFIDDNKLLNAVKLAGIDYMVKSHEMGLDLEVGERGEGLSGGEKQAITLARAVVHDPSILILDEPTSQMDNLTEQLIIQNLKNYCQDKTLILITHKFSLLPLVDRVIIIDNGEIIEDGPKDMILKKLVNKEVVVHA